MKESYQISVVMAVYNVEPFLEEAIESVIAQDIGFENIQLILVDDGSPDGSGAICDRYAQQYPENVLALHKENGGVSSARNMGLEHVRGSYVNFLDADDKLSPDSCSSAYAFLEANREKVDVASIQLQFFDAATGSHVLNYKYKKGTRIIDLITEWDAPQLAIASCFVRADSLKGMRFDTRLSYAEDAQLLQKLLLKKMTLGVIRGPVYWYRRRSAGELSAIQSGTEKPAYYIPYIRYFPEEVIQYSISTCGFVPRFVQYCIMYDLQWRIKAEHIPKGVLSEQEEEEYKERLFGIMKYIDDDVIMAQKNLWREYKLYLLRMKGSDSLRVLRTGNDIKVLSAGVQIFALSQTRLSYAFLSLKQGTCTVEGRIYSVIPEVQDLRLECEYDGSSYPCETIKLDDGTIALDEKILERISFRVDIPLRNGGLAEMFLCCDGLRIALHSLQFDQFFPLSNFYKNGYYAAEGYVFSVQHGGIAVRKSEGIGDRIRTELKLCAELRKGASGKEYVRNASRKAAFIRPAVLLLRKLIRRPIWLISDRIGYAGDNGEALFRYLQDKKNIRTYFVISKASADYKRMKKLGAVVNDHSFMHKLLWLLCDYNISSHADAVTVNPFAGHAEAYRDLGSRPKFIFLQHGITKDDMSGWLNRYNKNIYGFITAVQPEYDSIVNGEYHYKPENVWLTGFPRFDRLYHDEKKQISIMPTWRRYLMGDADAVTAVRPLIAGFETSEFFTFYKGLLSHPRLLQKAKELGYQICFFPHPTLKPYAEMFDPKNSSVRIVSSDVPYRDIYAVSSLVVTDYSSAVFDFAYLRKPVLYAQFDRDEVFSGKHVYSGEGYFVYERDGFGEVEYDLESTVDRIVEYMETDCRLKDKYRDRIEAFFSFHDCCNSERVYRKILELEE